jgi:5-formyltetrahydrofolate cyclo-ligase
VTEGPAAAKVRLRAELRERLARQSASEREAKSERIVAALDAMPEVRAASLLVLHRPLPSEVSIDRLLALALARGQRVLVPRVAGQRLELVSISVDTDWRRSTLGVLEPHEAKAFPLEDLHGVSVVIVVPGLGFDARRNRLGRGGGHYDRFIAVARAIAPVLVVGVAYELQVVSEIPAEPHDENVDRVATETRILVR